MSAIVPADRLAKGMYWGRVLAPTCLNDPATGEPLYVYAKVRPMWYWQLCRIRLFLSIVWRMCETERISVKLAWKLSDVAVGLTPDSVIGKADTKQEAR